MEKKTKTERRKKKPFIFKVSKFSSDRLHIEIPLDNRKDFQPGEHVEVRKLANHKVSV